MSQAGRFSTGGGPVTPSVLTLTGNTGGAVGPDGGGNIDVVGSGSISVAGNAGTNTLTISNSGAVATSFPTDVGTAIPALGALTIAGGNNIGTVGVGSTVTIHVDGTTNHAVQVGSGTGALNSLSVGTNGQVLLGATSADPSFVTPTAGTGLSITTNSTTLEYAVDSTVPLTFAADSGTATAAANIITFAGGTNVTTSATGSTITIDATAGGSFTWTEVTGTSQAMAVNNGYILNNAGLVTATLPSTAAVGDIVRVAGKGAGGWLIAQNSGQTIFFGSSTTSTGVGGSLASTNRRDCIELICVTANNDWDVLSSIGNITVV